MTLALLLACAVDTSTPRPIPLDRAACDACSMLISDGRFAAQLVTRDGVFHEFDDPACLFRFIADQHPNLANVWFRDASADGEVWLDWHDVEFVPATGAPMDGGLAAAPVGTEEGALSFSAASSLVLGGAK